MLLRGMWVPLLSRWCRLPSSLRYLCSFCPVKLLLCCACGCRVHQMGRRVANWQCYNRISRVP